MKTKSTLTRLSIMLGILLLGFLLSGSMASRTQAAPLSFPGALQVRGSGTENMMMTDEKITATFIDLCGLQSSIPEAECNALEALYNSTAGSGWTDNTGWLSAPDPCDWYGVSCFYNGVASLQLVYNNLIGSLPAALGDLTHIELLQLQYNQLSGVIPIEMGNMTNLWGLSLYGNQLSGEIPVELSNLTNLNGLGLGDNQLSGSIPPELGGMTSLGSLTLYKNQLSGSIPFELGLLTNLYRLDLYDNQLTGSIPPELGGLTNLQNLNLSDNQLSGIIPPELGGLTSLIGLNLSNNQLNGNIPPELGGLTSLTGLYLSNNQLSGNIPPELGGLTSLTGLYLSNNQLSGNIPPELGDLTNLTILYLSGNQLLHGPLPLSLSSLTLLTHFGYHTTNLCEPDDPAFQAWLTAIPYAGSAVTCVCNTLALSHTGSGTDPAASPTNSVGCSAGQYFFGEPISLSGAVPDSSWYISGWTGTDNDASTVAANTLTMPASAHAASVNYSQICYTLTLAHTGSGSDPIASPTSSATCGAGEYVAGEVIDLTAAPDPGWAVSGWSGTDDDASTSTSNIVTMPAKTYTQVNVASRHSCGLQSDGSLLCWGDSTFGQNTVPAGTYTQVSTSSIHTCGLQSDGTIVCWGTDNFGQTAVPTGTYTQVSTGVWFTCGLQSDGTIVCWGYNGSGQTTVPAGTYTQVSAGSNHTCGLKSDGTIVCWGWNNYGQTTVPAGTYTQVSAGGFHTCGLKSDGSLVCWGNNGAGQTTVPAGTYTQVSAGWYHTCGLKSDGSLLCWGDNGDGQTTVPAGTYTQVSAGADHTCGLQSGGSILCWGDNTFGQTTVPAGAHAASVNYYEPPGVGTYDDRYPGINYSGSWSLASYSGPYAGTFTESNTTGSTASFTFDGEGVTLVYTGYTTRGTMDIYIDAGYVTTLDQYSSGLNWQQEWTSGALGAGVHTISFEHVGGATVDIDAFIVTGPPPCHALTVNHTGNGSDPAASPANSTGCPTGEYHPFEVISLSGAVPDPGWVISGWTGTDNDASTAAVNTMTMPNSPHTTTVNYVQPPGLGTYDDRYPGINYSGSWSQINIGGPYLGTLTNSTTVGNSGTFTFDGEGIKLVYLAYSNGTIEVSIDGGPVDVIDTSSGIPLWQLEWTSGPLAVGVHTIALTHASGANVYVDAFIVTGPLPPPPPPACHILTLTHTGNGTTPTALPTNSTGCAAGEYHSGEVISLSGAAPDPGWVISRWTGTDNDTSTAATNTVTMPNSVHMAGVKYIQPAGVGIYDDRYAGISYSGSWLQINMGGPYLNTLTHSKTVGNSGSFTFDGVGITLVFFAYKDGGTVQVSIDGVPVDTIDMYSSKPLWLQEWYSGVLAPGWHTITFTHISGPTVYIDAFIVY